MDVKLGARLDTLESKPRGQHRPHRRGRAAGVLWGWSQEEGPEAALGCLDLNVFACGSWGAGRPARGPWGAGSASHASRIPGSPSRGARSLRVVLPVWVLTARPAGPSMPLLPTKTTADVCGSQRAQASSALCSSAAGGLSVEKAVLETRRRDSFCCF